MNDSRFTLPVPLGPIGPKCEADEVGSDNCPCVQCDDRVDFGPAGRLTDAAFDLDAHADDCKCLVGFDDPRCVTYRAGMPYQSEAEALRAAQ